MTDRPRPRHAACNVVLPFGSEAGAIARPDAARGVEDRQMRIKKVTSDVGDKIAGSTLTMLTIGVLMTIWGGVWLAYLSQNAPDSEAWYFFATGVLLSGLTFGLVGIFTGRISRAANEGDEPAHVGGVVEVAHHSERSKD